MDYSDEKLVEKFLNGDDKALEAIVDRYLKPLYNFVFQLTRDQAAAEDIVQDVFVKTWKNLHFFDADKKFSTWIYAIAKNTALDWLKKKKTFNFSFFEKEDGTNFLEYMEDDKALSSKDILASIDARADAQELLRKIPLALQTILLLHLSHGFSFSEIAEIIGEPLNTVKSKYRRAILGLRSETQNVSSRKKGHAPKKALAS